MKNIKFISLFVALVFVFSACNKDDYTGDSSLVPTNPTITVDFGTVASIPDAGDYTGTKDSTVTVNLSMDVRQIVDVAVHVNVIAGEASLGDDFSLSTDVVTIRAGETTASFNVTIIKDDVAEATETFTLQVGDDRTANANLTPVTSIYTIPNFASDDMVFTLEWSTDDLRYDEDGELIDPRDVDMDFYMYDAAFTTEYAHSWTSDYEEMTAFDASVPDGDYILFADMWSAPDFGDLGGIDLDFIIGYTQPGVKTGSFEFEDALNTGVGGLVVLCNVTKLGNVWTVTSAL